MGMCLLISHWRQTSSPEIPAPRVALLSLSGQTLASISLLASLHNARCFTEGTQQKSRAMYPAFVFVAVQRPAFSPATRQSKLVAIQPHATLVLPVATRASPPTRGQRPRRPGLDPRGTAAAQPSKVEPHSGCGGTLDAVQLRFARDLPRRLPTGPAPRWHCLASSRNHRTPPAAKSAMRLRRNGRTTQRWRTAKRTATR